jgi:hypothetical protein
MAGFNHAITGQRGPANEVFAALWTSLASSYAGEFEGDFRDCE